MRLCRFRQDGAQAAFYADDTLYPLAPTAAAYAQATADQLPKLPDDEILPLLGPEGPAAQAARAVWRWLYRQDEPTRAALGRPTQDVELLTPIPQPKKIFLLAGNYTQHIEEGGEIAAERAETFPYVFMKPPSTTLTAPGAPVAIPEVSPAAIDWELELAVIVGKGGKRIPEAEALSHVAGYTVINDLSDRKFRPNPGRKPRERDRFFDWMHGKWHDGFCPCGPCAVAADAIDDPQKLQLQLKVNGQVRQDASTAQQIFPVAAVIEFISRIVTLEPGDIISTGTPSGVGNATQTYLKAGDLIEASISSIGVLITRIE